MRWAGERGAAQCMAWALQNTEFMLEEKKLIYSPCLEAESKPHFGLNHPPMLMADCGLLLHVHILPEPPESPELQFLCDNRGFSPALPADLSRNQGFETASDKERP